MIMTKNAVNLENAYLKFTLHPEHLIAEIIFKPTGDRYAMDIGQTAGIMTGPPDPDMPTAFTPLGKLLRLEHSATQVTLRFENNGVLFEEAFSSIPVFRTW